MRGLRVTHLPEALVNKGSRHQFRIQVFRPVLDLPIVNIDDETVRVVVRTPCFCLCRPLHLRDNGIPFGNRVLYLRTNPVVIQLLREPSEQTRCQIAFTAVRCLLYTSDAADE